MKRLIRQRMAENRAIADIFDAEIVARQPNKMAFTTVGLNGDEVRLIDCSID